MELSILEITKVELELIDDYWTNLSDFFNLIHELISETYDTGIIKLNPAFVKLGINSIIGCHYNFNVVKNNITTKNEYGKNVINTNIKEMNDIEKEKNRKLEYKILFIELFVKNTYHHWSSVIKKDKQFIINYISNMFSSNNYIKHFKTLFGNDKDGNSILTEDDFDVIWEFIESLINKSILFIHNCRNPTIKGDKNIYSKRYLSTYEIKNNDKIITKKINIKKYAKEWDIELIW